MSLSHKALIEKLNMRLSGTVNDDPKPFGADEIEEIKTEDAYPVDFEPLKRSLNATFGKEAFLYPEKENDEIMCVYFDPGIMDSVANEFTPLRLQDWCIDKGYMIVSRMQGNRAYKVYFTQVRLPDKGGEAEPGKEYSRAAYGETP